MVSDFTTKVYTILRTKVTRGKVTTYKALAEAVGTKAYRAIGQLMNKNPHSFVSEELRGKNPERKKGPKIPCHRVISTDGTIGGFDFDIKIKEELLAKEGITLLNDKIPEKYILRKL